jgi:hypothetical protein
MLLAITCGEVTMSEKIREEQKEIVDNGHQKTVSGKNQKGPEGKVGKSAGGNAGSKGQNFRAGDPNSVGSHKPGGDGPGTKKFKYEHDDANRRRSTES